MLLMSLWKKINIGIKLIGQNPGEKTGRHLYSVLSARLGKVPSALGAFV